MSRVAEANSRRSTSSTPRPRVGQRSARSGHGERRGVLVVAGHPPRPDAGQLLEQARGQVEPGGGLHAGLQLIGAHLLGGQG
jgi:hypothetical protein